MPETRAMVRFREAVLTSLAELKTSQQAIIDHLARLNGSVAKHEEAINQMKIEGATRNEAYRINGAWIKAAWGVVGALLIFSLEHIGSLVAPFLK